MNAAHKGQTAFFITKDTHKCFRPGKTEKERKNGKHTQHLHNLAARAQQQQERR